MKSSTRWILYSLFRVGLFAAALVAMMLLGIELWLAAIIATVVAFSISYIFFSEPRDELARDLSARRENAGVDADSDLENEALDRLDGAPLEDASLEAALKNNRRRQA